MDYSLMKKRKKKCNCGFDLPVSVTTNVAAIAGATKKSLTRVIKVIVPRIKRSSGRPPGIKAEPKSTDKLFITLTMTVTIPPYSGNRQMPQSLYRS